MVVLDFDLWGTTLCYEIAEIRFEREVAISNKLFVRLGSIRHVAQPDGQYLAQGCKGNNQVVHFSHPVLLDA